MTELEALDSNQSTDSTNETLKFLVPVYESMNISEEMFPNEMYYSVSSTQQLFTSWRLKVDQYNLLMQLRNKKKMI